jgi:predicted TIM-barrel fold metal-dependent hydrolase
VATELGRQNDLVSNVDLSKVVDWHMHCWLPEQLGDWTHLLSHQAAYSAGPDRFEEVVERSGIGGLVVVGLQSRYLGIDIPNEFIAETVSKDPQHRIGVASIDPSDPKALVLADAAAAMGLKGIKLSPPYQDFHPHSPKAWALYERASELGLFLLFHQGWVFDPRCLIENANPILLDRVAGAFPNMKIIIAHLGQPWLWETIGVMIRRKNVFTDLSARLNKPWQVYNALMSATEYKVTDRILFGSDFPIMTPREGLDMLLGLNDTLPGGPPIDPALLRSIATERPFSLVLGEKASNVDPIGTAG